MPPTMRSLCVLLVTGAAAVGLAASGRHASWADEGQFMQVLADATLIDAECRTTNALFGLVFRYGEEHGIRQVDILPLGKRRQDFETATAWRVKTTAPDEICGSLQDRYRQAFPDWFSAR